MNELTWGKIGTFIEIENTVEITRDCEWVGEEKRWGLTINGYRVSVLVDETVLEVDSGGSYTTLWM